MSDNTDEAAIVVPGDDCDQPQLVADGDDTSSAIKEEDLNVVVVDANEDETAEDVPIVDANEDDEVPVDLVPDEDAAGADDADGDDEPSLCADSDDCPNKGDDDDDDGDISIKDDDDASSNKKDDGDVSCNGADDDDAAPEKEDDTDESSNKEEKDDESTHKAEKIPAPAVEAPSPKKNDKIVVSLILLDAPELDLLQPDEYDGWGLCTSCGVQTHEVFARREGGEVDATSSKVKLPVTIPDKVELGRCLTCKPKKSSNSKGKRISNKNRKNKESANVTAAPTDDASHTTTTSGRSPFPELLDDPQYDMVRTVSQISNGDVSASTASSEPSQESNLSWSGSEVSEDSILSKVVAFAAQSDGKTDGAEDDDDIGSNNINGTGAETAALLPTQPVLKYKKRTGDDDSIGTSIATSVMSTSVTATETDSSDESTVVSDNKTGGAKVAKDEEARDEGVNTINTDTTKAKETDAPILEVDQSAPSTEAQSSQDALGRTWRRVDLDDDTLFSSTSTVDSDNKSGNDDKEGGNEDNSKDKASSIANTAEPAKEVAAIDTKPDQTPIARTDGGKLARVTGPIDLDDDSFLDSDMSTASALSSTPPTRMTSPANKDENNVSSDTPSKKIGESSILQPIVPRRARANRGKLARERRLVDLDDDSFPSSDSSAAAREKRLVDLDDDPFLSSDSSVASALLSTPTDSKTSSDSHGKFKVSFATHATKKLDASILKLDQSAAARRAPSNRVKLAREWSRVDLDDDPFLYPSDSSAASESSSTRSPSKVSASTNMVLSMPIEGGGDGDRPKWTARTAIMTHEEELQAMLSKGVMHDDNASVSSASSIDSTSGDIECMAARLRKQYGVGHLNFPAAASVSSSGKGSSLSSGGTPSTADWSSDLSSSGWISQSLEGEKFAWNKKVLGLFSADKILGRHRIGSNKGRC